MRFQLLALMLCGLACLSAHAQQDPQSSVSPTDASAAVLTKPDLTPDASGKLSQEQMRALTRTVAENYRDNYKKLRDYTYIDREISHHMDGNGQVKSTETKTFEIMELYGEQVARLIEKDDKPLDAKDSEKEEERIRKITDKRKNETEDDRRKRAAEQDKRRQKSREFVSEVADAYNFRLIGSEVLNGRDTWVIDGDPRADFQAHLKEAEMLSKFRGRLWIDKTEMQLAKMDVEAIDTAAFGWVLARIHKGTRFVYEQTRINDEVWLPQHYEAKVDMRIALFRSDREEDAGTFRDYRKFRTTSKIVGMGEAEK
jgi:hypothetical protein